MIGTFKIQRICASFVFLTLVFILIGVENARAVAVSTAQFQQNAQHTGQSAYSREVSGSVQEKWKLYLSLNNSSPTVNKDGTIYAVGSDNLLYAINPDGTILWTVNVGAYSIGAPAVSSNGNIHVAGSDGILYTISAAGSLLWTYATENRGPLSPAFFSSPTVLEDGTIFLGNRHGFVYSLSRDGVLLWKRSFGYIDSKVYKIYYSTPSVGYAGNLYIQTTNSIQGTDGRLYALDMSSGETKWEAQIGAGVGSTATVAKDGTVYVSGTVPDASSTSWGYTTYYAIKDNGNSFEILWQYHLYDRPVSAALSPDDSALYFIGNSVDDLSHNLFKLDAKTGSEIWRYRITDNIATTTSAPLVDVNGNVYFGTSYGSRVSENSVHAVSPDGKTLWTYSTISEVLNSPTLGPDGTLYVGSKLLYAIANPIKPSQFQQNAQHSGVSTYTGPTNNIYSKWSLPIELRDSSPTVTRKDIVYVVDTSGMLWSLDIDGSTRWQVKLGAKSNGAPAVNIDGSILVAGVDGILYAVSESGTLLWTYKTKTGYTFGEGSILGSPAVADDGTIYIAGVYGDVNALSSTGALLWSTDVQNYNNVNLNIMSSTPTIGKKGNLYIQTSDWFNYSDGYLFALDLKTGVINWASHIGDGFWSTATVAEDGIVYVSGKLPIPGSYYKKLSYYAIQDNGNSSNILWQYLLGSGSATSAAMSADGKSVYFTGIPSNSNRYHLIKVDAHSGAELWRYKPMSYGLIYNSVPLVDANGTVYIGTGNGDYRTQNSIHAISPDGVRLGIFNTGSVIFNSPTLGPDGSLYIGSGLLYSLQSY